MIFVDLKTSTPFDWVAPLTEYLQGIYGNEWESFNVAIEVINRMRQDAVSSTTKDNTCRDRLYKYQGQLQMMDRHFPLADPPFSSLQFEWTDSFTKKPLTQASIAYEKASVIFNMAAILSQIACENEARNDDEGLKVAFNYFQLAAGVFRTISDNFMYVPIADMSNECITIIVKIMLAQAQECFCKKTINDNKKPLLISKLMYESAMLYSEALSGLKEYNQQKNYFPKTWQNFLETRSKWIESKSHYYRILSEMDTNVAHSICRAKIAKELIKDALKTALATEKTSLNSDLEILTQKETELIKSNDVVYHQASVEKSSLSSMERLQMAKPTLLKEVLPNYTEIIGKDLFEQIVPIHVLEKSSFYSEEKAKLIRTLMDQVEKFDEELDNLIVSLSPEDVIKVVESSNSGVNVPDNVVAAFNAVKEENSNISLNDIESLSSKVRETLNQVLFVLDTEARNCESMRVKYEDDWKQEPSNISSQPIRNEVRSSLASLDQAMASDTLLKTSIIEHQESINLLRSSLDKIKSVYPAPDLLNNPYESVNLQGLKALLKDVAKLKQERSIIVKDAKQMSQQDQIDSLLASNKHHQDEVIAKELSKYHVFNDRLQENKKRQIDKFDSLEQEIAYVRSIIDQDDTERKRNLVTRRLLDSFSAWQQIRQGFKHGIDFYTKMNNFATKLLSNANEFVHMRQVEQERLVKYAEEAKARREQEKLKQQLESYQRKNSEPVTPQQSFYGNQNLNSFQGMPPSAVGSNSLQSSTGVNSPAYPQSFANQSFNVNPNVNQSFNPNVNPSFNPNVNQSFNPNVNQSFNPNVNQSFIPNPNANTSFNANQSFNAPNHQFTSPAYPLSTNQSFNLPYSNQSFGQPQIPRSPIGAPAIPPHLPAQFGSRPPPIPPKPKDF